MDNSPVPSNSTKDEYPSIRSGDLDLKKPSWTDLVRKELDKIRNNLREITPCVLEEVHAHGNILRATQTINQLLERNEVHEQRTP